MVLQSDNFYQRLQGFNSFSKLADLTHYTPAPEDWLVVLTDIKGSTRAIEAGRYKDVNALGVASIIVVRNAIKQAIGELDVPFVFGGDGATLLIPPSVEGAVSAQLAKLCHHASTRFGIELRAGIVPISVVHDEGKRILVGKHNLSEDISIAVFSGGGLAAAEEILKSEQRGAPYMIREDDGMPDLTGFECRWNPIPTRHQTMVSLLVVARDEAQAEEVYGSVLGFIDDLTHQHDARPISSDKMSLSLSPDILSTEVKLLSRSTTFAHRVSSLVRAWTLNLAGSILMSTGAKAGGFDGQTYVDELVCHTDYRKFDDALRSILDLSNEQADRLESWLFEQRAEGTLDFGIHRSDGALMTCMVDRHDKQHLHFVDGSQGGYARAAIQLKRQLKGLA